MRRYWRGILAAVAVISLAIAFSYPYFYHVDEKSNNDSLQELADMRREVLRQESEASAGADTGDASGAAVSGDNAGDTDLPDSSPDQYPTGTTPSDISQPGLPSPDSSQSSSDSSGASQPGLSTSDVSKPGEISGTDISGDTSEKEAISHGGSGTGENKPGAESSTGTGKPSDHGDTGQEMSGTEAMPEEAVMEETEDKGPPTLEDLILDYVPGLSWKQVVIPEYEGADAPVLLATRKVAENRKDRNSPLPYTEKKKVRLDKKKILPELKAIYARNHDLVGWIFIEDTVIDYPVVQTKDSEFYLNHDFYGKENVNGQIILDTKCDPYTPSYNLVISGHHMNNGSMFGDLPLYSEKSYWKTHKIVEFDNLMERKKYVIFAAFRSADYDEYEEGFRYNADIRFLVDAERWLAEIEENQLYDTGIDVEFGDEFVTLTTCDRSRRQDGRFVLVCRRIREGETIK